MSVNHPFPPSWACLWVELDLKFSTYQVCLSLLADLVQREYPSSGGVVDMPVPHTPHAFTLTSTSSSRSSGRGTLTTSNSRGLLYLSAVVRSPGRQRESVGGHSCWPVQRTTV